MSSTFGTASTSDAPPPAAPPHAILVGLPGAGKSSIGRAVAVRLGRPFLDFDAEIERREGMTVSELFAAKGEAYFRALECLITEELRPRSGMVLAPGGGWVTNPRVVLMLRPPARLVYLRVRPETALRRLGHKRSIRPLLTHPDPLGELRRLLERRQLAYEAADHVIDTERLDRKALIETVAQLVASVK
ncbi:MAG TPA: shikimate kinase [Gemmatimonadaceae bacterium]|nr:shikimate kinase [Gemmatimonadaceae bacterium]